MKRQSTDWEKIFAKYIPKQELVPRIQSDVVQLNRKKTNHLITTGPHIWANSSPKQTHKGQINAKEDAYLTPLFVTRHSNQSYNEEDQNEWHAQFGPQQNKFITFFYHKNEETLNKKTAKLAT